MRLLNSAVVRYSSVVVSSLLSAITPLLSIPLKRKTLKETKKEIKNVDELDNDLLPCYIVEIIG